MPLAGAGITEAQMTLNVRGEPQLVHAQLRIAALAVADDEQAVFFRQGFHRFRHAWIADFTLVFKKVAVFRFHAPLHQVIAPEHRNGCQNGIGDLRHHLAEEGLQGFGIHCQVGKALSFQLDIIALGHQGTGVPQGAVNVKNQALVVHASSKYRWMWPMIMSSATQFLPPSGTMMSANFLLGSTYFSCMGLTVS